MGALPNVRQHKSLEQMVDETDLGGRKTIGGTKTFLFYTALIWSLFQIYIASPLPYLLGEGFVLGTDQSRMIHYAFAIFLGFCAYPAFRKSSREKIPIADWLWAIVAASTSLYMFFLYEELSLRAAAPLPQDIAVAAVGAVCLLEAVRRTVGMSLVIVATVFIIYIFAGPYMPDVISHRGASITRAADHMWLSREGVFGFTLAISSSVVFLFVMFGAMLEKAGAGDWFIKTSFALLGHLRGGPAKAAVVSSGLMGVISGSALANVVTTGTFTIPLMKRVGFSAEKAAGIESTSSINGQLMPPVMGAAAFLMTEFVGISYREVVVHAFLPATISYIGLFYIVHLEAVKLNLPALEKAVSSTFLQQMLGFLLTFMGLIFISGILYFGFSWVKEVFGSLSLYIAGSVFILAYLVLVWVSTRVPELVDDGPEATFEELPQIKPTVLAGVHFLLPVVVLIWCLMVERFSPGYAIYWAILAMAFVTLTQRPLIAFMRGRTDYRRATIRGFEELIAGFVAGARNMIGIGIALAAAGIIVGAVSLTGLGLVMVNVIEVLSGGNLIAMLFFTAVISIILGMGLPTTANYVVVASIMAPVVVTLAAQSGVVIPLIAVHMFVFYCGLMSGNTPPVAVDAYAAAALAQANPMQTCLQAFYYGIRTILLPFIFVFNTELLLIGVNDPIHFLVVVTISVIAMLLFVAAMQHYFIVRNTVLETVILLVLSLSLLLPSLWIDQFYPPYQSTAPAQILEAAKQAPSKSILRVLAQGEDFSGEEVERWAALPLADRLNDGAERLDKQAGLVIRQEDDGIFVEDIRQNGAAQAAGMDFDWKILSVEIPRPQPSKYWVYPPALIFVFLLVLWQYRRRDVMS